MTISSNNIDPFVKACFSLNGVSLDELPTVDCSSKIAEALSLEDIGHRVALFRDRLLRPGIGLCLQTKHVPAERALLVLYQETAENTSNWAYVFPQGNESFARRFTLQPSGRFAAVSLFLSTILKNVNTGAMLIDSPRMRPAKEPNLELPPLAYSSSSASSSSSSPSFAASSPAPAPLWKRISRKTALLGLALFSALALALFALLRALRPRESR